MHSLSLAIEDSEVPVDDTEQVESLPLVLVDSLDLDIKELIAWIELNAHVLLDPLSELDLALVLVLSPLLTEDWAVDLGHELGETLGSDCPILVSDNAGDELRKVTEEC